MSFVRDGHLFHTNHRRVRLRDFSFPRFILISSIVAMLLVTNPANKYYMNIMSPSGRHSGRGSDSSRGSGRRNKDGYTTRIASEWLGIEINIKSPKIEWLFSPLSSPTSSPKKRYSNYMLFSLSKNYNGVDLHVLLLQIPLCTYRKHGVICEWIADNFCQEMKMWDPDNRPFSVMRLVQIIKLISYALQSCYMPQGRRRSMAFVGGPAMSEVILWPQAGRSMLASFLSTLYQPTWHSDFISFHLFLYPTLTLLDRITLAGTSTQSQASLEFFASALGLIYFVAALSNHIAYFCTNENHIRGMKASLASALGYCCAAKPNLILLQSRFLGIQLTSGDLWFHAFALSAALNLLGLRSSFWPLSLLGPGHWRISDSIAWGLGGMLGYGFCKLQLEQYNLWWWSFY